MVSMAHGAAADVYDVIVVGYGPTGMTACALLGKAGLKVAMFERWPSLYGLPRAGHIDHEIVRILQEIGVADEYTKRAWANETYVAIDGKGDVLFEMDWSHDGISGWYSDWGMPQDELEEILNGVITTLPTVELNPGWEAQALRETDDYVEIEVAEGRMAADGKGREATGVKRTVRGKYLIGADGANSFVRESLGIPRRDLGYNNDWVVVDLAPNDPNAEIPMPHFAQIMDPARPGLAARRLGRNLAKFEWMVLPGEDPRYISSDEFVWKYVGERYGLTRENSSIVRNISYTFRGLIAETWRVGRILLAGDAAHSMPPFMAQGMCSGVRDAKALAWRLDAIFNKGLPSEPLLASFQLEREPHAESITKSAIHMGKMVATIDPEVAAARDRRIRAGDLGEPAPVPPLRNGILHRENGEVVSPVGQLSLQAFVMAKSGHYARFDDVVGHGWLVLSFEDPRGVLTQDQLAFLDRIGAHVVQIFAYTGRGRRDGIIDRDSHYRKWFDELGAQAIVVRPDFYNYGVAAQMSQLPGLIDELQGQLLDTAKVS